MVATPIGNLGDLSPRAVKALAGADYIYCEDTRRTLKLLNHAGIAGPRLVSHHRFNEAATTPTAMARAKAGAVVAIVTDAGTPLVSDPGARWYGPRWPKMSRSRRCPARRRRWPPWSFPACRRTVSASRGSCPGPGASGPNGWPPWPPRPTEPSSSSSRPTGCNDPAGRPGRPCGPGPASGAYAAS